MKNKSGLQAAFDIATDQYLKSKPTDSGIAQLRNELFEMAPFVDIERLSKLASERIKELNDSSKPLNTLSYIHGNLNFKDWTIEIIANFAYLSINSHFDTITDAANNVLNAFIALKKKEANIYAKSLIK